MHVAAGIAIAAAALAVAVFAPAFTQWMLPALGVLWALVALATAARLDRLGTSTRQLRVTAIVIGLASAARLAYLLSRAA